MPFTAPIEASRFEVISFSTSSGLLPGYSVQIVTDGYLISGKRFTGSLLNDIRPKTDMAINIIITVTGLRIIVFSIYIFSNLI